MIMGNSSSGGLPGLRDVPIGTLWQVSIWFHDAVNILARLEHPTAWLKVGRLRWHSKQRSHARHDVLSSIDAALILQGDDFYYTSGAYISRKMDSGQLTAFAISMQMLAPSSEPWISSVLCTTASLPRSMK